MSSCAIGFAFQATFAVVVLMLPLKFDASGCVTRLPTPGGMYPLCGVLAFGVGNSCVGLRLDDSIVKLLVSLLCVKRAMIAESHGSCLIYPLSVYFLSSLSGGNPT